MKTIILLAALFADPETTMLLRAENELLKAKIAAMEAASEPSPGVLSPQPPALHDEQRGPAVQTLRERIRAYRDSGGEPWYEEIGGRLSNTSKAHLNLEHKWTAADMQGLTADELNLLHGASHTGKIVPGKTETIVSVLPTPEVVVYSPASFNCSACNAWKSVSIPGVEIKHVRKDWSGWRSYPVVKVNGRHYYSPTVEQVKAMLE